MRTAYLTDVFQEFSGPGFRASEEAPQIPARPPIKGSFPKKSDSGRHFHEGRYRRSAPESLARMSSPCGLPGQFLSNAGKPECLITERRTRATMTTSSA